MLQKSLGFFEKPHITFKKTSIPLKMYLKRIAIFKKSLKFSENIFKMTRILKKKASHSQTKSLAAIAALPQWPLPKFQRFSGTLG
jgi:hypothetical protein